MARPTQQTINSQPPPPPFTLAPLPVPLIQHAVYYPQYSGQGSTIILPMPPTPTTARTGTLISQANVAPISSSLIQPSVQVISQTEPKVLSSDAPAPPAPLAAVASLSSQPATFSFTGPQSERFNVPFKASGLISSTFVSTAPSIIEQPIQGLGVQPPASATSRSVRAPSSEQTRHLTDGTVIPALFPRNDWQPVDRVSSFVRRTNALLQ